MKTEIENPTRVNLREMRLRHMLDEMKKDDATRLKLASGYASIANYWKFYDGEAKQLLKYKVYEQKQADEARFKTWASGKPEFNAIFSDLEKAYEKWKPYEKHRWHITEGILGSPLLAFASSLMLLENDLVKKGPDNADVKKLLKDVDAKRKIFVAGEVTGSDKNIVRDALMMFYNEIDKSQTSYRLL
jgi:hypothetical protein